MRIQERFKEQFKTRPKTLDDLLDSITDYIQRIPRYTLQRVLDNMMRRIDLCVEAKEHHFLTQRLAVVKFLTQRLAVVKFTIYGTVLFLYVTPLGRAISA